MTAVNVIVRPDKAFLMTDGAVYAPNGTILGFGSKAMPIPNLNAAIAVRGLQGVANSFGFEFSIRYRDFDDMIDRLQADLSEWRDNRAMHIASDGWDDVDLYIVGWSEKDQRMKGFNFATREDPGAIYALATVEEITPFSIAPDLSSEEWLVNLRSIGVSLDTIEAVPRFDPVKHGVPIMQAQRRMMEGGLFGNAEEALSIVGGHITVTEIDRHGISQRIVHRWNDEAGVPIVPEPFVAPTREELQKRRLLEARRQIGVAA